MPDHSTPPPEYDAAWAFNPDDPLICAIHADGDAGEDRWRFPDRVRTLPTGHGIVPLTSDTRPDTTAHALLKKTDGNIVEVYFVARDARLVVAAYLALNILHCTVEEAVALAHEAKWEAEVARLGALRSTGPQRTH